METFILSFLLTSLIMSILILLIWIIHQLAANIFTAKLRYLTWIVILIGFLIPIRISIGHGIINLSFLNQVESQSGTTVVSPPNTNQLLKS